MIRAKSSVCLLGALCFQGFHFPAYFAEKQRESGARYRVRTYDPIRVKDVLYH